MKRLKIALVAAAALALPAIAFADGYFPNFPIVGSPAYCSSFSQAGVPGTAPVCNVTTPAGPAALTGDEIIIADTKLVQGQQPQTVGIDITSLGAGPYLYNAPLTGASITLTANLRRLVLEPAGTIAALTVVFPAATALRDGQLIGICTRQAVTALTITSGAGTTVLDAPTALTAPSLTGSASCPQWLYRTANTSWYRVQ